jgi:hypothetical protein
MNNRYGIMLLSATCCIGCMFLHCMVDLAGGGTEDVNTRIVMGKIYRSNNQPAFYAQVKLIPGAYDPVTGAPLGDSLTDTTDADGAYTLKAAGPGVYNIVAVDLFQRTRLLIAGVTVQGRTTIVPPDSLEKPGAIKAFLPDTVDRVNGYLHVPGTNIAVSPGGSGFVIIDSIPAGLIPALEYAVKTTAVHNVIRYAIPVVPGDTAVIFNPAWKYARQLLLNTTASGAGVQGNVTGFPVLVRLTSGNFNFAEAEANGDDLRFTKPDNTPLPYEIERWNASPAQAEIWVRADTVYGNDSTHCFVMYWGNQRAADSSNSAAVFDTGSGGGFAGVWHLAQAGNTTAYDATANHSDGTPTGMSSTSAVAGNIGVAQRFNGSSSGITLPNTAHGKLGFYGNGSYSFSAWVYADTLDTVFQPIIAKSNYQYALQIRNSRQWEFFIYKDSVWQHTRASAVAGRWKYIAGVRENDRQYLFVDGILVNGTVATLVEMPRVPDDTTRNVTIGYLPEMNRFYKGMIDEVRAMNRALSADWIKLSYMNQKSINALVEFR